MSFRATAKSASLLPPAMPAFDDKSPAASCLAVLVIRRSGAYHIQLVSRPSSTAAAVPAKADQITALRSSDSPSAIVLTGMATRTAATTRPSYDSGSATYLY